MGKPKFQDMQSIPRQKNHFAVLADSDSEGERVGETVGETVGERVGETVENGGATQMLNEWVNEPIKSFRIWKNEVPRFTSNVFNSPFTKKGKKKEEVWTTIDTESITNVELDNKFSSENKYPSMLYRGKVDDEMNALAWAEKVKISLEKAKNGKKTERMSFFKRNLDEKN